MRSRSLIGASYGLNLTGMSSELTMRATSPCYGPHLNAFAFTGIGNLGVEHRTDLWLARAIGKWEEETPVEQQSQDGLFRAIAPTRDRLLQRSSDFQD